MRQRGISERTLLEVLENPEQVVPAEEGNLAFQSRVELKGKTFLLRVVVDVYTTPPTAVTAYITDRITKYWSAEG
jgi:hypothetical protein